MSQPRDPHERKCRDCGNVAIHEDRCTPWVLCKKCGSQDTRAKPIKTAHQLRCEKEGTRDVIFLLQIRQLQIFEVPFDEDEDDFEFEDGTLYRLRDGNGNELEDPEPVPLDAWLKKEFSTAFGDLPCVWEEWRTESVWLDRGEAEKWAKAHEYHWKHGWRVYGIYTEGDLAKLLQRQHEVSL